MRGKTALYFFVAFSCVSGLSQVTTTPPVSYTYTTISVPQSVSTELHGINNFGSMVGQFTDASGVTHGFMDAAGIFTTIDAPGAVITQAFSINSAGEIVGTYIDAVGLSHGFTDIAGAIAALDVPGASSTAAYGVNDSGYVVGGFTDSLGEHGFLYTGTFSTLSLGTHNFTLAARVNDSNQIVGYFDHGGGNTFGFLDSNGKITNIESKNAAVTEPLGINNLGGIVGIAGTQTIFSSFTFSNGVFGRSRIRVPGSSSTQAQDMNDAGQIVGWFDLPGKSPVGFLAVPH